MNDRIRVSPIRVIDQHQNQLGVIPVEQALSLAREAGLDLVEVSPTESPPVCRIVDYGKQQYEKKKRQKASAGAHTVTLKEIRIRPKTDPHDRQIKIERVRKFLDQGHKVQFTMLFRGRERFNRDFASAIFEEIIAELGEAIKMERRPLLVGRRMTMVVAPAKPVSKAKKKVDKAKPKDETKAEVKTETKADAKVETVAKPETQESAGV